jgi:hypothetical protein
MFEHASLNLHIHCQTGTVVGHESGLHLHSARCVWKILRNFYDQVALFTVFRKKLITGNNLFLISSDGATFLFTCVPTKISVPLRSFISSSYIETDFTI